MALSRQFVSFLCGSVLEVFVLIIYIKDLQEKRSPLKIEDFMERLSGEEENVTITSKAGLIRRTYYFLKLIFSIFTYTPHKALLK